MKNILLLAGIGLVGFALIQRKNAGTFATTNPDSMPTLAQSSVSNSVPMPGTATRGSVAPAAPSPGKKTIGTPSSLGSDTRISAASQVSSPDAVYYSSGAAERADFVNPFRTVGIGRVTQESM